MSAFELLYYIPLAAVMISWFAFAGAMILMKKPQKAAEEKRDRKAVIGIIMQGIAFALVATFRRDTAYLVPLPGVTFDVAIAVFTVMLSFGSVWMTTAAIKKLGRQWSVAARIVEQHRLITNGPYGRVRNPIYSGMLGMLVATGLAFSTWYALLLAAVIYWFGAMIRVKIEERLLRKTFGAAFDDYARRVPPLIPKLF
ncbi:MAG TPA: isoprenylcysteine carboxylmethyltransferase family protein [Bacteroidota bacterium]|jgi:protein-S-isoprenylcysteine O-methyltransferase Ste14|nr:isoprenylcysteine carboxylmethyltransferase family protein [Bacteroidota bacterium]